MHSVWKHGLRCPACLAGSRAQFNILQFKDAIELVPPAKMRQGFYSPYFIVPKKGGGLRPILDLRVLNRALHKLPFKMLTHRCMIKCIQPQDRFAAIDLKDAYFHVSILPRHRRSYGLRSKVGHGSTGSSYMQRAGKLGALDRAPTALAHQLPRAVGSAFSLMAVPATAVGQACASPHGQHCVCLVHQPARRYTIKPMSQLARHLLLWSHTQFKSLRAVHIPGKLNRAADALSRQLTFPGEWRLHPETIRLICSRFGETQVDLFASSHCQLYFSLNEGPLGTDAQAHSWHRALRKYAFTPVSLLAQTLCKLKEDKEQVLLVAPH